MFFIFSHTDNENRNEYINKFCPKDFRKEKYNMDIVIQRFNEAHNSSSKLLNAVNGKGMLQNYIAAKLTNSETVRLLLYQDQLEQEKQAIANQILAIAVNTLKSIS